jgi:hypothetical protein
MSNGQALLVAVLDDMALRFADPRRWVQGTFEGIRSGSNVRAFHTYQDRSKSTCWCLTTAVTMAVSKVLPENADGDTWCELRASVEAELLATVEATTSVRWGNLISWNDAIATSYADVLSCLNATRERLKSAA